MTTTNDNKPLWKMRLDRFDDYDIQMTATADDQVHWQILGVEKTGERAILKEMDSIPYFRNAGDAGFEVGSDSKREYHADDTTDKGGGLKDKAMPFVFGLVIGGFGVYMAVQAKLKHTMAELIAHKKHITNLNNQLASLTQGNGQGQQQQQQQYQQQNYQAPQFAPNMGAFPEYTPNQDDVYFG